MGVYSENKDTLSQFFKDKTFQKVYFLPPTGWVWEFKGKPHHLFLLDFTNDQPCFNWQEFSIPLEVGLETHGLTDVLHNHQVTQVQWDHDQRLHVILSGNQKHIELQLAPYLPRFSVFHLDQFLFDSILGWQPQGVTRSKVSQWQKNQDLTFDSLYQKMQHDDLIRIVNQHLKRKIHRENALMQDREGHRHHLHYLDLAEAIKSNPGHPWDIYPNPHHLPLPQSFVHADFSAMNHLYELYKRAKRGLEIVEVQREENQKVIQELKALISSLARPSPGQIEDVKRRLKALHLISGISKKTKEVKAISPYFVMVDQVRISFGKNAKQNHHLTFEIAKKQEIFLHLHHRPGSHVILHHPQFDHELIVKAAQLVLELAKLGAGEVTYAKVGSLKATSTPGQVIVKDAKTIKVNANPTLVASWLKAVQRY